jgi:hypothetical protein
MLSRTRVDYALRFAHMITSGLKATCTLSPRRPPAARIDRAINPAHLSMSRAVSPTTVGWPVVPQASHFARYASTCW